MAHWRHTTRRDARMVFGPSVFTLGPDGALDPQPTDPAVVQALRAMPHQFEAVAEPAPAPSPAPAPAPAPKPYDKHRPKGRR